MWGESKQGKVSVTSPKKRRTHEGPGKVNEELGFLPGSHFVSGWDLPSESLDTENVKNVHP